jgi:hypothetical protein
MKSSQMIKLTLAALALATASSLMAQPFYLRGSFNGWDTSTPMNDEGGGLYSATISGTPGERFIFKVANADWSVGFPGSDVRSLYDAGGSATVYYRAGAAGDGWSPAADRVGYADPGQFGWEVIGSFNGWSAPILSLANQGAGLYTGQYLIADAGSYNFKFREAGSWDISIGADFGNSAGDAGLTTLAANQLVEFQLDLPNGKWSATVVPEPTVLGLVAGSAFLVLLRRRKA